MYEHGTLYSISIAAWPDQQLVVQNDRVVRTTWLLEWPRGATTSQLHHEIETRGWRALALRAATPEDCARPDPTPVLIQRAE